MWVRLKRNIRADRPYHAGEIADVGPFVQSFLEDNGAVEPAGDVDPVALFMGRLDVGAGEDCLFLPFVGEFGHQIIYHVRFVHWHRAAWKLVCCRRGLECLYPTADEFFYDWSDPIPDSERGGPGFYREWPEIQERHPDLRPIQAAGLSDRENWAPEYCIRAGERIPLNPRRRGLRCDVAIGTRRRAFTSWKNWGGPVDISAWCRRRGLSYAVIGTRENAFPLDGMTCMSGDYGDVDAAVELLQGCRLFVGADSGSAHLAAMVGAKMVVQAAPGLRSYVPRMRQCGGWVEEVGAEWWGDARGAIGAMERLL